MIIWAQWLSRVLVIILVVLVERAIGIPMLSILLATLFCSRLSKFWCYGLMLFSGLIISALFMQSLSRTMIILGLSFLWLKYAKSLISSQFVRLITAGALGAIVLVVCNLQGWRWEYFTYVLIVILISFLGLKRRKLSLINI